MTKRKLTLGDLPVGTKCKALIGGIERILVIKDTGDELVMTSIGAALCSDRVVKIYDGQ